MKTIYRKTYNPFRMEIIEKIDNEYEKQFIKDMRRLQQEILES